MTREDTKAGDCAISLVRALSVPLVGLIFALILVFTRILMASSVPGAKLNFPEPPFGPGFQLGIRTIALVFGLSCAPGLLVGIISGHTIAHNNRLTLAFLSLLRIWQWAPIIIWWVLIHLIFFEFNQSPGRFSYILMIGVPAIAMSSCYHYLLLTNRLRTDWRTGVADATRVAVLRAFLVSIVMALSIWMEPWFAYVETDQKSRHYLTVLILSFLLAIIHWNYRSGLQHSRELYRKLLLTDRLTYGKESFWLAGLIFAAITALWQSLYGIGTLKVSASSIVIATLGLIQTGEIWKDMWVSLQAIMVGITGVGTLAMGVAMTYRTRSHQDSLDFDDSFVNICQSHDFNTCVGYDFYFAGTISNEVLHLALHHSWCFVVLSVHGSIMDSSTRTIPGENSNRYR